MKSRNGRLLLSVLGGGLLGTIGGGILAFLYLTFIAPVPAVEEQSDLASVVTGIPIFLALLATVIPGAFLGSIIGALRCRCHSR
ncbi:MAG: hypothetical protein OHK0029_07610 [Armatimonadaceae bacterium]